MSDDIRSLMFAMLRRELRGEAFSEAGKIILNETEARELYTLSCRFGLSHLVGDALRSSGAVLPEDIAKKFKEKTDRAVYRFCVMQNETDRISALFEKEKIPFIPLKGAVLRDRYPEPWMRFSNDIDILVHPEDMKRAENALVSELCYERFKASAHEVSFMSKTKMHLELHFDLIEDGRANTAKQVLNTFWDHASHAEDSCCCTLDAPMFCFYHIAHMAKHFTSGQCGIRLFLDLWILNRLPEFRTVDCDRLLAEGELDKFSVLACRLSEVWLSDAPHNEDTRRLEDFVFEGTYNNRAAVQTSKHQGRSGTILSKFFIPYDVLKIRHPILRKHRWLTPFIEIKRWVGLIFRGRIGHAIDVIRNTAELSDEKIQETALLFDRLGLK